MSKSAKILLATALLLIFIVSAVIYFSTAVFVQLFIAFALACMMNPAVDLLERKGIKRLYGILIVFCLTVFLCSGFAIFLIISISGEFSNIQINLPAYIQHLYEITSASVKGCLGIETDDKPALRLNELLLQARSAAPDLVKPLLLFLRNAFTSTISVFMALLGYLVIPVYLFYFLFDLPELKNFITSYIPVRFHTTYANKLTEIDTVLSGFVQMLEGAIITPRIVGDTVGLNPLVAIVALLIGGQLFGVAGMLLAVPVTAVLQVFLRSLSGCYLNSEFYRER